MKSKSGTVTSKGQIVIPANLRRKLGIRSGTKISFTEDAFGGIVLQPITEEYISRFRGCLKGGEMLESWREEHRAEGEREKY